MGAARTVWPRRIFTQLIQPLLTRKMRASAEQKFMKGSTDLQRTIQLTSAHAYELECSQPPVTARDLIPQ